MIEDFQVRVLSGDIQDLYMIENKLYLLVGVVDFQVNVLFGDDLLNIFEEDVKYKIVRFLDDYLL